ncbi:MAG: efflux RND transporter periplasmic adaptor subunit [Terracidiphilus sp.]|jgi:HlyD family secretion protein
MEELKKQSGRTGRWIVAAVIVVIVFFAARYMLRERLAIREVQVTYQELVNTVPTNGRVEPETNYEYHSPVSTTIKAVYVQPGDHVPAGKLLVQLDDVEARAHVATAESGVKAAQAALEAATHNGTQAERQASAADITRAQLDRDQARHDLDALTKLNATGAASANEVAAAKQRLDTAEASLHASQQSASSRYSPAEVARAQAALTEAEANLAAAREVVAQSSYYAPISGTVYSLDAQPTDFAEAGKLLLQMADLDHERVRAYFDEPDIGKLAVGQQIVIRWDAKPGEEWHGHIARTPATVVPFTTRNVGEVLVALDGSHDDLLPDTNVTVTVTTSNEPNVLCVPQEAMHPESGKFYVYKVDDGKLKKTPVVTGTINLSQVAILSGLQAGDWVATSTVDGEPLKEGIPIKVVK